MWVRPCTGDWWSLTANCRHSFHPFVEGVSERTYTDEQLAHIDDGHDVTYDGKHYTAYEATQMQRRLERTIRKQKRLTNGYKAAGLTEDAQTAQIRLNRLNTKYKEFSKAAGLPEQRERMRVTYTDDKSTAAEERLKAQRVEKAEEFKPQPAPRKVPAPKYTDVTAQWRKTATPNSHVVQDAQEYTKDGVIYKVDGHNVVLDYSPHEKEIAELLEKEFGGELIMNPKVNNPQGVRVPDFQFRGEGWDLKTLTKKATQDTIFQRVKKSSGQAKKFVIDVTEGIKLTDADIEAQIKKIFSHNDTLFAGEIILIRDMQILSVVKRA